MEEKKSIYAAYEEIKEREIRELKDAVSFHGGKYVFNEDERPTICVNYDEGPEDVKVSSVKIEPLGDTERLAIFDNVDEEIRKDDIAYGNIEFITQSIPKKRTIEVSDEMSRLCETVAELSHILYVTLYFKFEDSFAVCAEIRRLAVEFEKTFDNDKQDFLLAIDAFAKDYTREELNL